MTICDLHGRQYQRLSTLRPGMLVDFDDGFDCGIANSTQQVKLDYGSGWQYLTAWLGSLFGFVPVQRLYVHCHGPEDEPEPWCKHFLAPQADDNIDGDYLIGVYPHVGKRTERAADAT